MAKCSPGAKRGRSGRKALHKAPSYSVRHVEAVGSNKGALEFLDSTKSNLFSNFDT